MNETQLKAFQSLADHWPLLLAGALVVGGLGTLLIWAFKLFFWNEDRIERVALKLLTSEAMKKLMTDVASAVFAQASAKDNEMRAEMRQVMQDLKRRDEERMAAVTRVHNRMDELQNMLTKSLMELMQMLTQLLARR